MHRKLYIGALTDNRRWDHIRLRSDDVIVSNPPKSGTTWMQTIIALLLSGDPDVETELTVKMPWIDIRIREIDDVATRVAELPGRRCLKSHTPLDGLPVEEGAQFICVFRHPLDAHFSFRRHVENFQMTIYDLFFPQSDDDTTFRRFLDGAAEGYDMDAAPLAHIVQHYKAAKAMEHRSNVTLFHYADMKRDLAGTFAKVAQLLGVNHAPELMSALVETATFENMRGNAERFAPAGGKGAMKSDADFFHSGTSGKWHGVLTAEQLDAYDYTISQHLSPEDRRWLEQGEG